MMPTIDSAVMERIERLEQKIDSLTALLKQQTALNGISKYMDETEAMQLTRLKADSLRMYRRYGVFTDKMIGGKRSYIRKEIEAYVEGKLAHKVYQMREQIKEEKLSKQTA